MISDRYEMRLQALLEQTERHNIKWRPITEYIRTYIEAYSACPELISSGISQYIQAVCTEWFELFLDKSFFVQKDGYILALLNYKETSGKDGSIHEILELVGGIYNSPVIRIPEYIVGGFVNLQKAVMKYWDFKEGDYNIEYSDSFELLEIISNYDNFTKQDYNSK